MTGTQEAAREVQEVQHLFARERLAIDDMEPGRTCFLSHIGAQPKLVPGPWIAHRDLLYALALANLTVSQRTSLARAVLVEHGHEFGVGRLLLEARASGLPLGGSSVRLRHRKGGVTCLYTWALGPKPQPAPCDWLLLRAQPEWALERPPPALAVGGMAALVELGGEVLVLVPSAVAAVQIAQACAGKVELASHPRFSPYIEGLNPEAPVLLWPHDALDGVGLRRRELTAAALVGAPEQVRGELARTLARMSRGHRVEVVDLACPGRVDRDQLAEFWTACGRPKILLRGDPAWACVGSRWLESLGATVVVQTAATQLDLL
jgi:hypothetical protein